jgi:2'-5' RNA ligase
MSAADPGVLPRRVERTRRLFFALWPDDALRASIAGRLRDMVPDGVGRTQQPGQLHLTLEFLGPVPESRFGSVCEAADAVRPAPCEVILDRIAYWRRSSVLCLLASATPPALVALVEDLRSALRARDFAADPRPYRAHLTLARKVWRPVTLPPPVPVRWPVEGFALVESRTDPAGSIYTVLQSWQARD